MGELIECLRRYELNSIASDLEECLGMNKTQPYEGVGILYFGTSILLCDECSVMNGSHRTFFPVLLHSCILSL